MFNPKMVASVQGALARARKDEPVARRAAPGARGGGATTAFAKPRAHEIFADTPTDGGFAFAAPEPPARATSEAMFALALEAADHFVFDAQPDPEMVSPCQERAA